MSKSKKHNRNRAPKNKTIFVAPKEKDEGVGPFRVTATVFGVYTHGKLVGKTNPKAFVRIVMHGDTVKKALGKLNVQTDGAFYRIEEIVDEGREAINLRSAMEDTTIVHSSGNVFDDLGVVAPEGVILTDIGRAIAPVVNELVTEGRF